MLRCRQYCLLVVLVPGGILAPLMIDRAMLALFAGAQREISSRSDESSRQDAADMSIDVPIWTCGSKEVATVLAHVDWTVRRVKEDLFQRFMVGADQQILVCCGKVLDENTAIVDLITQLQHEEKVWVVFRNVWRASLIRSKEDPLLPLLHSVFASGFSRPASAVCMDQCRKTFEEFCKSHRTMRQEKIGTSGESRYSVSELTWKPNEEEQTRLAASVQALRNEFGCTNYPQVKWFPEYGCALLVSSIDVTRLSLQIIGPDEWGFTIRQAVHQRAYSSIPQSSAGKTLHIAEIDRPSYDTFVSRVSYFLKKAQERKGEARSAAHNEQGHQKTPAMIMAVVTDSVKSMLLTDEELEEMALTNPRGGFTDVGVHTGGCARDTAWFILEAVVEILLGDHRLFRVSMAQIRIWLTECHFASVLGDASAPHVNQIMKMLAGAVDKAAPLADENHDMAALEARCAGVRYQLEEAVMARAKEISASQKLHPTRPLNLCLSDFETCNPVLTVPRAGAVEANAESLETRKEIAETNLGWLPTSLKPASTWHEASEWCSSVEKRFEGNGLELLARQLLCRNVESFFYICIVERPLETTIADIDRMESVLKIYRSSVYHLKQSYHRMEAPFKVGVQSRELLVVWAAFCMVHCSAKNEYRLLDHYGVAVHWSDLQHLVLFDKLAVDAALRVARYLRSSAAKGDPIFSHLQKDSTFRLAEEYARGNAQMQATWDSESKAASNRRQVRWQQVQAQQRKVRDLREEKDILTGKLRTQERELSHYKPISCHTSRSNNDEYRRIHNNIESLRGEISQTERDIAQQEQAPPPLLQPLPELEAHAMEIIFFLEMPRHFQVLLDISFMAQQMLLPRGQEVIIKSAGNEDEKVDIARQIAVKPFEQDWNAYYRSRGGLRSPVSLQAVLASYTNPPKTVGPPNVMSYTCDKDGVWHPDNLRPGLWWRGGSCVADIRADTLIHGSLGYFNPWTSIPLKATMEYFSEALPNNCQNLQWSMRINGRDRGNLALANQDAKPGWLSKPQFLSFASIRAFAHVQDRKVCLALHDQSLPMEHVAVHKLIAQALFQLGQLSDCTSPNQIWKTDRREGDLWAALQHALKKLADEICNKPRDHEKFPALAEIAAYAGQWDADSRNVSRQLGAIARTWADDLQKELQSMDAATPEEQQELASQRAKCCLFSMYAIMSYAGSAELSIEDTRQLCNLSLLAESNRMFEETTSYETAVRQLTVITQEVLTARLSELLACINQDPKMLTASVRLILQQTPDSLQWKAIRYSNVETSCFESVSPDGDLYTVNLLKGTVLFNGLPPSRLPSSILYHPLYIRCFADRNFEVIRKSAKLETIRSIRGCLYTFVLASSQRLIIEEVHPDTDVVFELLDGTSKEVEKWGSQLPIRLQTMHSHWICRSPPSGLNCEYWQEITLGGTLRVGCEVMLHSLKERKYNKIPGVLKRFDIETKRWEVTIASGRILRIKPENLQARGLILANHFKQDAVPFVVLRPKIFNQREIHFFLCNVINRDGTDEWHCFRIPIHLQLENIELSVLQRQLFVFDKLERVPQKSYQKSHPLRVLEKFESHRFTHAFRPAEPGHTSIILEFSRFDLCFRLSQGILHSNNFLGYFLAPNQQLENELLSFKRYLVLQNDQGNVKIVIPSGRVRRFLEEDGQTVTIETGDKEDSVLHIHAYDVHPRLKKLSASCIEARLQLAVLYAATGSLLPEQGSQKTGAERAVELLRESWVNRPLKKREKDHLDAIREFDEHVPSLSLLCQDIMQSSQELSFLHTASSEGGRICHGSFDQHISDAASDYIVRKQAGTLNERVKLASYEELNVLGREIAVKLTGRDLPRFGNQEEKLPSFQHLIENCGNLLAALKCEERCDVEVFPFAENAVIKTEMGRQMLQDLADSWEAYCNLKRVRLVKTLDESAQDLAICLGKIQRGREELEACLLYVMTHIPTFTSWHVPAFRLKMIANLVPIPSISDLAKLAFAPDGLQTFNPFLSESTTHTVQDGILQWLQLCVLEDKLVRMLDLVEKRAESALERELENTDRAWIKPFPEWLVFEMEQQLQIRGVQFEVARHLMSNPGAISQLNMGEGKTRVILPMLILQGLPDHGIFRLHILSPLLDEAYGYFHRTLTASLMCRRIHVLPFNRDVRLDATRVRMIKQSLMKCQQLRGVLCIAPEHRLSIHLKWHELRVSPSMHEVAAALTSLYDLPYLDILDESDEILRHKHQLIYAVGNCQLLPSGKQRWETIHILLERLQCDENVVCILNEPEVASKELFSDKRAGSFDRIRLIPGRALDKRRSLLMKNLAQSVLETPPHSMRWLSEGPKDKIMQFIMDPEPRLTVEDVLEVREDGLDVRHEQLLALRGFLAYGILEHCLTRRHRVDFGISRVEKPLAQMRRVAVPFRASDSPAERAEYAQPDIMIVFTYIAYYEDGLSKEQFKETVNELLGSGPNAQALEYSSWFDSSKALMQMEEQVQIDSVNKIDLSNPSMLNLMYRFYRYNMKTIHFWLSKVVLPQETMVFPHRLVANAWNLADNSRKNVLGFSGTNDTKLLLPLQLSQSTPNSAQLEATNGKMLAMFMRNSIVHCLTTSISISDEVLSFAVKTHLCSSLIDAGALMAGLNNEAVAEKIIKLLNEIDSCLKGVVYFDDCKREWSFRNKVGRIWSLISSPVHEREAFVYFDESRCRGADMKLNSTAVAGLTIGPGMCKDKLMQAAFRMRQLDRGQKLQLVLPLEVATKVSHLVSKDVGLTPKDVLVWTLSNTVESTTGGLPEWASQGSHFCTTKRNPSIRLMNENLGLSDLYGAALCEESVLNSVSKMQNLYLQRCSADASVLKEIMDQISSRAETFGKDIFVKGTGLDDECERELENERELEKEVEREIPRQIARIENDWDFTKIFNVQHPKALPSSVGVITFQEHILGLSRRFSSIRWDQNIYMTANFWKTVSDFVAGDNFKELAHFLRPVDAVLHFEASGTLLLLSERESDSILPLFWKHEGEPNVFLTHLSFMRSGLDQQDVNLRTPFRKQPRTNISDEIIASLQLFNGGTMFAPGPRRALQEMLKERQGKAVAPSFTEFRATRRLLARSDLEIISNADLRSSQ